MNARNRSVSLGLLAVAVVAAALLAAACGGSSGGSASPAPNFAARAGWNDTDPLEKTFSAAVSIQAGGEAYLVEADNPTTGYGWSFKVPPGVSEVSSVFTGPSPSASPLMGAGGTRTVTFRVPQPGTYVITGVYARPWEPNKPAKTARLSIYANPTSQPAPSTVFTGKDSPGTVTVAAGATFAVDLKENASTGFTWTMRLGPGLRLVHEQVVAPARSPSPRVGVGGQHLWFIKVEKSGTTAVTGIHARPANAATKSAADFSLTIEAT
ncbi:MAG TPA: protease inhibitor I42 family protein [Thermoleophilia bacterium]